MISSLKKRLILSSVAVVLVLFLVIASAFVILHNNSTRVSSYSDGLWSSDPEIRKYSLLKFDLGPPEWRTPDVQARIRELVYDRQRFSVRTDAAETLSSHYTEEDLRVIYSLVKDPDPEMVSATFRRILPRLRHASNSSFLSSSGDLSATWYRAYAPTDARTIISVNLSGDVTAWTLANDKYNAESISLAGLSSRIMCISATSQNLAVGCLNGEVLLYNLQNFLRGTILYKHKKDVLSMTLSPDGRFVASSCLDGSVVVWNLRDRKLAWSYDLDRKGMFDCVNEVKFSSDSRLLIGGTSRGRAVVFDVESGSRRIFPPEHPGRFSSVMVVALANDNETFATGDNEGVIEVWNIATSKKIFHAQAHEGPISTLMFYQGGKIILSGGWDGYIRSWNAATSAAINEEPVKAYIVDGIIPFEDSDKIVIVATGLCPYLEFAERFFAK